MKLQFGNVEIFDHTMNLNYMKYRKVFIGVSLVLTAISLLIIAIKGVNYSIDFLGGSEVTVNFTQPDLGRPQIQQAAEKAGVGHVEVTSYGTGAKNSYGGESYEVRIQREKGADENTTGGKVDALVKSLRDTVGADKFNVGSVTNISGKIGGEEQVRGYMAILLSFLGILIYTGFRFDSRFAPGAVICLLHDVLIALGFMCLLGRPFSVASIAAYLTIVGYSCNDTIIVYDRIRETQSLDPRMPLVDVINRSINQTMNRTVLTSTTGLLALLVLVLFGGGAIEDFALTMFVGILVGTYSSIYVAAPLTLMMDNFIVARGWKKEDTGLKAKVVKDPNYIPPVIMKKKPVK